MEVGSRSFLSKSITERSDHKTVCSTTILNSGITNLAESYLPYQGDFSENNEPSIWRLDPANSFSDWVIEVLTEDDEISATYHVHKVVLAAGSRRSSYFLALFQTKLKLKEHTLSKSRIILKDTAAEAFPAMLDFIYNAKLNVTTENAIALLHLATYFSIPTLADAVAAFSRNNMTWKNAHIYLSEAIKYHDERKIDEARQVCVENFHYLTESQICFLSPQALDLVLRSHADHTDHHHWEVRSIIVAHYLRSKQDIVNGQLIASLTDNQIMPSVCPCEAIFFLHLALQYEFEISMLQNNNGKTLRQRCIDACIGNCEAAFAQTSLLSAELQSLSSVSVTADIFSTLPVDVQNHILKVSLFSSLQEIRALEINEHFVKMKENNRKRPRHLYEKSIFK
jgi:hypothetical protein